MKRRNRWQGQLEANQQILNNIERALDAAGARLEDIVKWNVPCCRQNQGEGFSVFQEWWGNRPNPPVITVLSYKVMRVDC